MTTFAPKPALRDLRPYEPGMSIDELRRRIGSDLPIVKLGSNEGPWGPLPAAADAIAAAIGGLNRYPDGTFHELRMRIAEMTGADADQVVLGNGADAILINLSLALLEPRDEVVYGWPSFITYDLSVRKAGGVPVPVPLDAEHRYDLDAMLARVTDRTRMVYVCNPNNPTGTHVARERLHEFVEQLPSRVLCVVDEAYHEYVTNPEYPDSIAELVVPTASPRVLVLRTMSKIYGLAGLRIGWGVGPAQVVRAIDTVRGPFEMNALANVAALASFRESTGLDERVAANAEGRAQLEAGLRLRGLDPIPGSANFLCIELGSQAAVSALAAGLLEEGVIVRPLAMFGMPRGLRITVGTTEEIDRALEAIELVRVRQGAARDRALS